MTLNNCSLPYKKPILKQVSGYNVNTRGVVQEIDKDYGGMFQMRSSSIVAGAS